MRHEKKSRRYCRWISRQAGEHAPRVAARAAVTLLFVMNGFTRPQIIAVFIFRTAALLVIQFNGAGI